MTRAKSPTPDEVRDLREASGLTAQEFAEVVYNDAPACYAWEAGRREMQPLTWEFLNVYFGRAQVRTAPGVVAKGSAVLTPDIKARLRALDKVRKAIDELAG
jgi:hypothetical protein